MGHICLAFGLTGLVGSVALGQIPPPAELDVATFAERAWLVGASTAGVLVAISPPLVLLGLVLEVVAFFRRPVASSGGPIGRALIALGALACALLAVPAWVLTVAFWNMGSANGPGAMAGGLALLIGPFACVLTWSAIALVVRLFRRSGASNAERA